MASSRTLWIVRNKATAWRIRRLFEVFVKHPRNSRVGWRSRITVVYFFIRLDLKYKLLLEPRGGIDIGASVSDQGSYEEVVCFTCIRISRHVQSSAVCGCWFVNQCVIQHTSCQSSNLWHQLPVSFKIELWALRSAWTLTKSFSSSELNALHYYLISRSTQAGITAHPESIDELYKASSVQISQS